MNDKVPELPSKTKQNAHQVALEDGRRGHAWKYRDASIVVLHIRESGLMVTSIDVVDEAGKVYKGWAYGPKGERDPATRIKEAQQKALIFLDNCFERSGDNYYYVVKCTKAAA